MIGRAAVENPWIFSRRKREDISPTEVQELLLEHLERSLSFYGSLDGLVLFRKFAAAYLKPYDMDPETRKRLLTEVDHRKFKSKIDVIFNFLQEDAR
jgi:tRNA-dihydrouridine synthase